MDGEWTCILHCSMSTLSAVPTSRNLASRDLPYEFHKGIKCNPSLFPTLKDEKQWDQWHCSMVANARAQDVANILNTAYNPTPPRTRHFLKQNKKYMYAVFNKTLLTDQGKALFMSMNKILTCRTCFLRFLAMH